MKKSKVFFHYYLIAHILLILISIPLAKAQVYKNNYIQAKKISSVNFNNLYQVNGSIYRSEQPSKKGMNELGNIGIKTIINLRNQERDNQRNNDTHLIIINIPINTKKISYEDVLKTLKVINICQKPVLIHCLHGSDRTGAIIASYRMVFENWPKEKAIEEFLDKKYGYHQNWFPNIPNLLKSLDVEKLKDEVFK